MSSCSYSGDCPECGSTDSLMCGASNRPYDSNCGECIECGFSYWTQTGQMELFEVNEMRLDRDLEPLEKLKEKIK